MPIYVKADKVKSDHTYTQFPITINDNTDSAVPEWGLFGAGSQTGTPSHDNIIMPTFCGVRTGNLFDISTVEKGRIDNGVVGYASATTDLSVTGNQIEFTTDAKFRGVCGGFIEIPSGTESISFYGRFQGGNGIGKKVVFYDAQKTWLNSDVVFGIEDNVGAATIPNSAKFVRVSFTAQVAGTASISNIMLNTSSTALPYENFGYKIPITLRDFSCTILGVQQSTNYAYISKSVLPNASVGDYISTTIEGVDYSLAIMQIDDNYIYIENRTV